MNMNANHTNPTSTEKPLVVITGSSGLIGRRLVKALCNDFQVVGLDIQSPDESTGGAEWRQCDMTDERSVASALQEVRTQWGDRIASVIHLAAYYDFSGEPSSLYRDLTIEGTRRLLRELRRFHVEQFVFSSTLLVMKSSEDDQPVDALSDVEAEWDYPRSKLAAEKVIEDDRHAIPAVILRIAGVYDEDCHSLPLAQQISRIHQKQLESYFFPGDKSCGQAFVHIDDLINCFRHVIDQRGELSPHEIFVIGEEDVMSYQELQQEMGTLIHGKEWPAVKIPKTVAKLGAWAKEQMAAKEEDAPFIKPWMIDLADQNYPVDIHRARTQLGWEPQHTLRRTLPEMIRRLHEDPQRWYKNNGLPVPDDVETPEETRAHKP